MLSLIRRAPLISRAWIETHLDIKLDANEVEVAGYTKHRGRRGEIRFTSVDFSGVLVVADPVALASALSNGIGHAKAFGCGLLLLRPLG